MPPVESNFSEGFLANGNLLTSEGLRSLTIRRSHSSERRIVPSPTETDRELLLVPEFGVTVIHAGSVLTVHPGHAHHRHTNAPRWSKSAPNEKVLSLRIELEGHLRNDDLLLELTSEGRLRSLTIRRSALRAEVAVLFPTMTQILNRCPSWNRRMVIHGVGAPGRSILTCTRQMGLGLPLPKARRTIVPLSSDKW